MTTLDPALAIRPATIDDVDVVAHLRHALWPDGTVEEHRSEAAESLEAGGSDEGTLLAERGSEPIGFAEVSIRRYAEGCDTDRVGYLEGWYVAPHARRQGVGRLLVEAAEDWARARGCSEFASDTEYANDLGAVAHRALGFEDAGLIRCFSKGIAPQAEGAAPSATSSDTAVRESYDAAARAYAGHLASELDGKPLDRHLLNRFAEQTSGRGTVADLGCGPGHVARYLHDRGVTTRGVDLSGEMIACARELNPELDFVVGDMRRLDVPDASLAGVVSFYSIVHFTSGELRDVAREWRRVLVPGALALVAFHVGDEALHVEDLFGARVDLTFRFHDPDSVIDALRAAGLRIIERCDREPYDGAEYPSRRCYLLARAVPAEPPLG